MTLVTLGRALGFFLALQQRMSMEKSVVEQLNNHILLRSNIGASIIRIGLGGPL